MVHRTESDSGYNTTITFPKSCLTFFLFLVGYSMNEEMPFYEDQPCLTKVINFLITFC